MRSRAFLVGVAISACASSASAATWVNGTTPHLGQIFSVDATGEPNWIFGAEDVLGDTVATFTPAEQALDLRTAYAKTNATQLYTRVYVSSAAAADTTLDVFVFVNADKNTATGGGTNSTTLSPLFTTEKSPGGYEFVYAVRGDGTFTNVWQWSTTPTPDWVVVNTTPNQVAGEVGTDTDPIRIGTSAHAYVQGRVDLAVVGLTETCDANLYVRSARANGASDLDMSLSTTCVPADANGDKIPDIVVTTGCTTDAQCPQDGVCDNGACVLAPPCGSVTDCPANDTCTADGRCVPTGACTLGGNDCAAGTRCAPNGTCVAGGSTTSNGEVEGGAFHCDVAPTPKSAVAFGVLASLLALLGIRRRRS